jgi:hypothetical protein
MSAAMEWMGDAAGRVKDRRAANKMEHLDRENQRMRTELDALRWEVDRQRSDRDDLMHALKRSRRPSRIGRLFRIIVVGGGAYLMGAKAGKARYQQVMSWIRKTSERGTERVQELSADVASAATDAADKVSETAERADRKVGRSTGTTQA